MGNNRFTASQVALALLPVVAVALVSFLMAYSFAHYIAPVFEIPEAQAAAPSYDAAELEQAVEVDEEARQAAEEAGEPDPQSAASADYATSAPANGYADGTYMGSAYGFRSTITVRVTVKNGAISAVEVVSHGDDEEFFSRARGVIPSVVAAQSTDVDTVSGATYSSRGILAAVKNALAKAAKAAGAAVADADESGDSDKSSKSHAGKDKERREAAHADKKPDVPEVIEGELSDGVYRGSAEGFRSTIVVEVKVKNGKIAKVMIVSQDDDPDYFSKARALVQTIVDRQTTDVDVVSGATYSSLGIIGAVTEALKQAVKGGASDSGEDDDGDAAENGNASKENGSEASGDSSEAPGSNGDGTEEPPDNPAVEAKSYTGRAWCIDDEDEQFEYELAATIGVADGKVVSLEVEGTDGDHERNARYIERAMNGARNVVGVVAQLLGGTQPADIDVVSGATYSSNAIASAYAEAFAAAREDGAVS